jgi:hypothetical protein
MLVMVMAAGAPAHQRVTEPLAPNHRCSVGEVPEIPKRATIG